MENTNRHTHIQPAYLDVCVCARNKIYQTVITVYTGNNLPHGVMFVFRVYGMLSINEQETQETSSAGNPKLKCEKV